MRRSWLTGWLRRPLRRLLCWALVEDLALVTDAFTTARAARDASGVLAARLAAADSRMAGRDEAIRRLERTVARLAALPDQLAALQAIDIGFQETGKIVVLAHVGGQDRVEIISTAPRMTTAEYRCLVRDLTQRYGTPARFVDAPPVLDDFARQLKSESFPWQDP